MKNMETPACSDCNFFNNNPEVYLCYHPEADNGEYIKNIVRQPLIIPEWCPRNKRKTQMIKLKEIWKKMLNVLNQ